MSFYHSKTKIRSQIFLLETLYAAISSCFGIVEHYGHHTVDYHDCYSPHCATIGTPTNDNSALNIFNNRTCWFDTHCCLPDVSVSAAEKEKGFRQSKELCKDTCSPCFDYCNPGTDNDAPCFV